MRHARALGTFVMVGWAAACGGDNGDAAQVDGGGADDAPGCTTCGGSIGFSGQGDSHGDRIHLRLDDPATTTAGPPLDVGATDFTIEWWMRGAIADNPNTISCGEGIGWTQSNVVIDRDRHSQRPTFGAGVQAGALVWAVTTAAGALSLCGDAAVADGAWHHVAIDRRRGDGRLRIWVDGALDVSADGPDGDVSYPDDGVPMAVCPLGSCAGSDPFLVLGAEKHGYPDLSFTGLVDELRVSRRLRYDAPFARPTGPFAPDADTVGLYHLDEGAGTTAADASGIAGAVDGELVRGGAPPGPTWSTETPFGP